MLRRAVPGIKQLTSHGLRLSTVAKGEVADASAPLSEAVSAQAPARAPQSDGLVSGYNKRVRECKRLENQNKVDGCRNLVDVREIMKIYREARNDPARSGPLQASDVVNAILTTTRQRMVVLRSVLSRMRSKIIAEQNKELSGYLHEIVDDLEAGRCYLSRYAITYMLTAFATMDQHAEATKVWQKLAEFKDHPRLEENLQDPKVVGAALHTADPSAISLDSIENTYNETVKKHGKHILLDEALANGYLRFGEYEKAAELYADICSRYDVRAWGDTVTRLHNRILTDSQNRDIGSAFFKMAIEPNSHVLRLHPTAAARFFQVCFKQTKDIDLVIDGYGVCVHYFTRQVPLEPKHYQILTTEVVHMLMEKYPIDSQTGRQHIERLLEVYEKSAGKLSPLLLNTLLSAVYKQWPRSLYINTIAQRLFKLPSLGFDSYRVLLNSAGACEEIPAEDVATWWLKRKTMPPVLQIFDWMALASACNYVRRVDLFVHAFETAKQNGTLSGDQLAKVRAFVDRYDLLTQKLSGETGESGGPGGDLTGEPGDSTSDPSDATRKTANSTCPDYFDESTINSEIDGRSGRL